MPDMLQFLFILAVPVVLVAGGLVTLLAAGALLDALERPDQLRSRIEGAFRRPPAPPKTPGAGHYYKAYWSRG